MLFASILTALVSIGTLVFRVAAQDYVQTGQAPFIGEQYSWITVPSGSSVDDCVAEAIDSALGNLVYVSNFEFLLSNINISLISFT